MTCQELVDFLMAYLDGELPAEQRGVFEEHVRMCPPCEAYLVTYQEAVKLGKAVCDADSEDLPADVPEPLIAAILAARTTAS